MSKVTINISEKKYTPIDPTARWGVANMNWAEDWWTIPEYSKWTNFPMSCKKCDEPIPSRGRNVPVSNDMWDFIHKVNNYRVDNPAGISFIESVDRLIINRRWKDRWGVIRESSVGATDNNDNPPDPYALSEPIFLPVNPLKIKGETKTHYLIDALDYKNINWRNLDPRKINWVDTPHLIPKACAESRTKKIQNVMGGVDAYWMNLAAPSGAWIEQDLVVLLPDPQQFIVEGSRGVGYRPYGSHWIMGLENGRQVYVRRVTKSEGVIPYHGWKPNFRSVVPPAWFI